jgi:hypothetical protein
MPKRIVILDPNGVEVASEGGKKYIMWDDAVEDACELLRAELGRENPKLGTYTVTVKEIGDG